jgi:hypothetical protein
MKPIQELKQEFSLAIQARDGVRLGNVAHKLRCNYRYTHKKLIIMAMESGLDQAEFDELIRQWDDSDGIISMTRTTKDLSF